MIKELLGKVYHPILHKLRNSSFLHTFTINRMVRRSVLNEVRKPRLYVDVTNVHNKDTGTGIARVTKEISSRIVKYNQKYDVNCIYNRGFDGYFDCNTNNAVTFSKGDIYFGLDNGLYYCDKYDKLYKALMKNEIPVYSFFHDLIPVRYPELCKAKMCRLFDFFLRKIVNYTGIICNSRSTCEDLQRWFSENPKIKKNPNLFIRYSLLGSDFSSKNDTDNLQNDRSNKTSFLMVATVEPKKKYDQAVKAFDILWKKGFDIELIIVGRKGWKAEKTFELIENNPEYNKRLFWYNTGISDEKLYELYQKSTAVIMASITEGFGLAVAEAAQFKKPLIIRNIPPFKEIAGENAYYFDGFDAEDLADAVEKWLELYKSGMHPDSKKIELRTWNDCAKDVYELLTGEKTGE